MGHYSNHSHSVFIGCEGHNGSIPGLLSPLVSSKSDFNFKFRWHRRIYSGYAMTLVPNESPNPPILRNFSDSIGLRM